MRTVAKKISVIALIGSTLIFAGCGKSGQDMTFQETYATLKSHNIFGGKEYKTPDITKVLHDETVIDFSLSAKEGFSATGKLISKWSYNLPGDWVDMKMSMEAIAFEPSFGSNMLFSGEVQFAENSGKIYWSLNSFNISPEREAGNVEWWVINALANTISKKWIDLSWSGNSASLVPYRANIVEFFHQFNRWRWAYSLFKEAGTTTIDGYAAYKIAWDEEWIKKFVEHILKDAKNIWAPVTFDGSTMDQVIQGIVASPIEWYMIIKSRDHVILRIDSITTQDSGKLSFIYDKNWLELTVKDNENIVIATGSVGLHKRELHFGLTLPGSNVDIQWQTLLKQWKAKVTLTNPEFILTTLIGGETKTADVFTAVQIQESIPLTQIIEWFSLIGQGMMWEETTSQ
jgi:hypothetical protein